MASRMESFLDRVEKWIHPFWAAITKWFAATLARFITLTMEEIENDFQPKLAKMMEQAEASGKVPPEVQPILDEIKNPTKPIAAMLGTAAGGIAAGGIISSTIGPWLLLLQYEIQRVANQARWDPMTAAAVLFRMPEMKELVESDIRDQGWTQTRWDALIETAKTRLKEDDYVILRFRFGLDEKEYKERMGELGYTPDRAEDFYHTRLFYPTPSDLVHWQAREVFEPKMVEKYGLDDESGDLDKDAFYKAGMDDPQIVNYWRAHWEHASWNQVTDMLHRGLITEDEVWAWFRLVEIPPFWRKNLIKTAYVPYTRVDVRRMHKIGTLDRDGVKRAYLDHGYDDDKAEKMTEFTLAYNAGDDRLLSRSEVEKLYKAQTITRVEAETRLADLNYNEVEISLILDSANVTTLESSRALTVSNLRQLYELDLIPKAEASEKLAELGYDSPSIIALYSLWDLEKPPQIRQPSRSQLDGYLANAIIGWAEWVEEYRKLGYNDKYIQWQFDYLYATGKIE